MRSNSGVHHNLWGSRLAWLCCVLAFLHVCAVPASAQVQTENGQVVATCGITVTKGQPFSFDAKGSLQTKQAGYFEGKEGKTYTLRFEDDNGKKALLKCKGRVAWDEEGRLVEGKDNFLAIMTEADNGKWHEIVSAELAQGIVSFTAAKGLYTDFSEKRIAMPTKENADSPGGRPTRASSGSGEFHPVELPSQLRRFRDHRKRHEELQAGSEVVNNDRHCLTTGWSGSARGRPLSLTVRHRN